MTALLDNEARKALVDVVKDWLSSKHTISWAEFDLSRPERLQAAAEWWVDQWESLAAHTEG